MASVLTSDDYEGLLERPPHNSDCDGVPSTCACGVSSMWALVSSAVPITPRTGKWLIFPGRHSAKVDALWGQIVSSTEDGKLGFSAKIKLGDPEDTAIMVYTADCEDHADLKRVQQEIRALLEICGIPAGRADQLKYKTDEATRQKIFSHAGLARRQGDGVVATAARPSAYLEHKAAYRDGGYLLRATGEGEMPWSVAPIRHPGYESHGQGGRGRGGAMTVRRSAPCKFYSQPGGCRFGAGCKFEHAPSQADSAGAGSGPYGRGSEYDDYGQGY